MFRRDGSMMMRTFTTFSSQGTVCQQDSHPYMDGGTVLGGRFSQSRLNLSPLDLFKFDNKPKTKTLYQKKIACGAVHNSSKKFPDGNYDRAVVNIVIEKLR